MKKIIITTIIALLLINIALATTDNIIDTFGTPNDPLYHEKTKEMNIINKIQLKLGKQNFDNTPCATSPDRSQAYSPINGNTQVCYTNNKYAGVTIQQFQITKNQQWNYIIEQKIERDTTKCFKVTKGQEYHFSYFLCGKEIQRSCTDTDGLNYTNQGTSTFTIQNENITLKDTCMTSTFLLERYCDKDNIRTETKECRWCSKGTCQTQNLTFDEKISETSKTTLYAMLIMGVVLIGFFVFIIIFKGGDKK